MLIKTLIKNKWNSLPKWQKTMIIILGLIVLPITLIGILAYIFSPAPESNNLENDKWHHAQQKKQVEKAKKEIDKAKKKTERILVERQYELEEIGKQNEEAADIITDIRNANTPDQLDELRNRINNLGK